MKTMSNSDMANLRYQLSAVIKERQCTNVSTQRIRKKLNNGLRVKLDIHGTQLHFITKIETISKPPKLCHKAVRATNTPRKATKPFPVLVSNKAATPNPAWISYSCSISIQACPFGLRSLSLDLHQSLVARLLGI